MKNGQYFYGQPTIIPDNIIFGYYFDVKYGLAKLWLIFLSPPSLMSSNLILGDVEW